MDRWYPDLLGKKLVKRMSNVVLVKHPVNWGLDEERVNKLCIKCLSKRDFKFRVELSLVFAGIKKARSLNQKFRKMDYVPQVLGFSNSRSVDSDGLVRLGDVVICTDRLKKEMALKENKGKDVYEVLEEWIDHGIDNLLR